MRRWTESGRLRFRPGSAIGSGTIGAGGGTGGGGTGLGSEMTRRVRVYNSAAISIPDSTLVALTFDTERFDTHEFHSTTANTDRLTIVSAGTYLVGASVEFAANATGLRELYVQRTRIVDAVDEILVSTRSPATATGVHQLAVATLYAFVEGDYVSCIVGQNSGGALNVNSINAYTPEFWMMRVA